SAVTNNGATKLVADASAMGRNPRPEINSTDEPNSAIARVTCNSGRFVCSANSGEPGTIAGTMISANTRNRIQVISIDGSVFERYFDVASDVPRKMPESNSSPMPRNGRSARADAADIFFSGSRFSGSDDGALSSLKAAAGGVTVELWPQ